MLGKPDGIHLGYGTMLAQLWHHRGTVLAAEYQ